MSDIPHNWTPTFRLTSIEKPDMSPYLFHMTSRESLKSILENEETEEGKGRLLALKPRHCKKDTYDIPMVCFTESPPFALDFFRYRWSDNKDRVNLKYGIGFDKEAMVLKGVFPTFYVSHELQSQIFSLAKRLNDDNLSKKLELLSCENGEIVQKLNKILNDTRHTLSSVQRLMFPLLENFKYQGYVWEREWRYTSPNNADFIFSYDDIRIICCADEDENIFKDIIGKKYIKENPIQFIRTWKEYDEITDFLNRRNQQSNNINQKIQERLAERKGIESYIAYLENQEKRINKIKELREILNEQIKKIALIKVFEEISKCSPVEQNLKIQIMENDCEIVINAIAAYHEQSKKKKIDKPEKYLLKVIQEKGKPNPPNREQKIAEITKRMNEIIEIL